ncbi:MAG: hotdog fold thioesterase [Spirochaetales bacterium]|nr:hotdog fold thioesterase [Spirochaetales bacterium]
MEDNRGRLTTSIIDYRQTERDRNDFIQSAVFLPQPHNHPVSGKGGAFMDINRFASADNFAARTGIRLIEADEGYAKASMDITKDHLNSAGTVHGGVLFTLADFVFAVACNSYGTVAVAVHASISYFKAVTEGTLSATAREVSLSRKLSSYTIEVKDSGGGLVALFQGMAYRKKDAIG